MDRNDGPFSRFFCRPEMKQSTASRPRMLMIDVPGKPAYRFYKLAELTVREQATQLPSPRSRAYRVPDHVNIAVRVGTTLFPADRGKGRTIEIMISEFSYQTLHVNLCTTG